MSAGLIAKKIGMSRVFQETGEAVPVTYVQIHPNTIVRLKTQEKDGYNAMVLGIDPKARKSRKGKEFTRWRCQKEWVLETADGIQTGNTLTADIVPEEATVTVSAVSKGKGFQGVIKRHNFSRGPETHGSHHHRKPGSVGMCEFPGRILKGKKMPGRMGTDTVTIKNRPILSVDREAGVIAIKGPVPGPNGGDVFITFEGEIDLNAKIEGAKDAKDAKDAKEEVAIGGIEGAEGAKGADEQESKEAEDAKDAEDASEKETSNEQQDNEVTKDIDDDSKDKEESATPEQS